MLTIRNALPSAPTFWEDLRANTPTLKGLCLWATTLLCFCALLQPTHGQNWMRLTAVNGQIVAMPATDENACRSSIDDETQSCVDVSLAPNVAVEAAAF